MCIKPRDGPGTSITPFCIMLKFVALLVTVALLQSVSGVPVPQEDMPVPPPTIHRGRAAKEVVFDPEDKQNPWQKSGHFEGDIMLNESISARTGLVNTRYRWTNRVMPYYIDPVFSASQRAIIEQAVADFNSLTCVTMRPYQNGDADYIWIKGANTGCWSYVGRLGGGQDVNLQLNGCVFKGVAIHEFLHAWGFYHMQSATERDNFVQIAWDNIQDGMAYNFDKYSSSVISQFGYSYDYSSVMHYDAFAFSKNGQRTIVPLQVGAQIGQIEGFSRLDILRLNAMYNC